MFSWISSQFVRVRIGPIFDLLFAMCIEREMVGIRTLDELDFALLNTQCDLFETFHIKHKRPRMIGKLLSFATNHVLALNILVEHSSIFSRQQALQSLDIKKDKKKVIFLDILFSYINFRILFMHFILIFRILITSLKK